MKYLKNQYNLILKSLKDFKIKAIFIVLYDLIFYSLSFLSLFIFASYLNSRLIGLSSQPMENLAQLSQEQLSNVYSELKGALLILVLSIIILVIVLFLLACIFKTLIWFKVAEKKLTINHLKKFIITKLVWNLIWFIPIVILFILFKRNLIAPTLSVLFILLFHLNNILYVSFIKNNNLKSIKTVFKTGTKKIHLFILPYIIIVAGFLIVIQLYWIYQIFPESIQGVISLIIILAYTAFSRIYFYNVVKDINP